jgi:hypothetical protein
LSHVCKAARFLHGLAQADSFFHSTGIMHSLNEYDYCLAWLPSFRISSVREQACHVRTGTVDDPYKQLEANWPQATRRACGRRIFSWWIFQILWMDQALGLLPHDVTSNRFSLALFLR